MKITKAFKPFFHHDIKTLSTSLRNITGSLLFADISGFTLMSERLTKQGKKGTEELTNILNKYFDSMLTIIKANNGNVSKVAGDSILVIFKNESNCEKCSNLMMREMANFSKIKTSAGKFTLKMKIVILNGNWGEFLIGSETRSDIFLCGKPIKDLAFLEDSAKPGEIKIFESNLKVSTKLKPDFRNINPDSFLDPDIKKAILSNIEGEHRPVSSVFIKLEGYNEDTPDISTINLFYRELIKLSTKFHGTIQPLDNIVVSGSKFLILFGVPITYGDDIWYSLLFSEAILEFSKTFPRLNLKISINHGYVFAGIIGNNWRREYTVVGDVINTGARLVETAKKNQIIVSESIFHSAKSYVKFSKLKSTSVKGKRKPLKRFSPKIIQEQREARFNFVGREIELTQVIDKIKQGKHFISITGAAGIGKSRLVKEITSRLKGHIILQGFTDAIKPGLFIFTSLIKNSVGMKEEDPPKTKDKKLRKYFVKLLKNKNRVISSDAKKKIPFLSEVLFGLEIKDSRYSNIEPKLREENFLDGLKYFIELHNEPIVVILDDLHYCEEEDFKALQYLTRVLLDLSSTKISFLITTRPTLKISFLDESINHFNLYLEGLNKRNSDILVKQILNNKNLEPAVDKIIKKKTSGNPFFIEQFLLYLIEKELIKEGKKKWVKSSLYNTEALPEDIFSMIMSRIERLHRSVKETLRIASVIGVEFNLRVIENILNLEIRDLLAISEKENLVYLKDIIELEYIFAHSVIKDVLYESILRQKRKEIHHSVGINIEKIYKNDIQTFFGILAYHFIQAADWEKAYLYSFRASEKTAREYRNDEALNFIIKSKSILQNKLKRNPNEPGEMNNLLIELYLRKNNFKKALSLLEKVYRNSKDRLQRNNYKIKIAKVLHLMGENQKAIRNLNSLEKHLEDQVDEKKLLLKLNLHNLKCEIYLYLGKIKFLFKEIEQSKKIINHLPKGTKSTRIATCNSYISILNTSIVMCEYKKAIDIAMKILKLKRQLKDIPGIAVAYSSLGASYMKAGEFNKALKFAQKSLALFHKLGDKLNISKQNVDLGLINMYRGKYQEAVKLLKSSIKYAKAIDDKRLLESAASNIGKLYLNMKELDNSIKYYTMSVEISKQQGSEGGLAVAYNNIGNLYMYKGEFETAEKFHRKALRFFTKTNNKSGVGSIYNDSYVLNYFKRDYRKALFYLKKACKVFEEINDKQGICAGLWNEGSLYFILFQYKKALLTFQRALSISKITGFHEAELNITYYIAQVYHALMDYKNSEKYFEKSIYISKELNNKKFILLSRLKLATLYVEQGKMLKAAQIIQLIQENKTKIKDNYILYDLYFLFAVFHLTREHWKRAMNYINKSLTISQKHKSSEMIYSVYLLKAEFFSKIKNNKKAGIYFNKAIKEAMKRSFNYSVIEVYSKYIEFLKKINQTGKIEEIQKKIFEFKKEDEKRIKKILR